MAKITTPAPASTKTTAPTGEAPAAPNVSVLIGTLAPLLATRKEGEEALNSNSRDIIIAMREFKEENPSFERNDCKLALQTVIAEKYSLKLAQVQNDSDSKAKGYSAYTLVSALLNAAWPKGEAEEKKVAKAIKDGKGYVEIRKAASKPQSNRQQGEDKNKITADNFANKATAFVVKAETDMAVSRESVLVMLEAVISALRMAPASTATPAS